MRVGELGDDGEVRGVDFEVVVRVAGEEDVEAVGAGCLVLAADGDVVLAGGESGDGDGGGGAGRIGVADVSLLVIVAIVPIGLAVVTIWRRWDVGAGVALIVTFELLVAFWCWLIYVLAEAPRLRG